MSRETLSALALRFYGDAELHRDASLYPLIATVNGIADPDVIDVGQILVIFVGRSDGFGLSIVDRNENDPRLWYYRFQTSAIGWNPGVNVLLPGSVDRAVAAKRRRPDAGPGRRINLKPEFSAVGVDFDETGALLDDALQVLDLAMGGAAHFQLGGLIEFARSTRV